MLDKQCTSCSLTSFSPRRKMFSYLPSSCESLLFFLIKLCTLLVGKLVKAARNISKKQALLSSLLCITLLLISLSCRLEVDRFVFVGYAQHIRDELGEINIFQNLQMARLYDIAGKINTHDKVHPKQMYLKQWLAFHDLKTIWYVWSHPALKWSSVTGFWPLFGQNHTTVLIYKIILKRQAKQTSNNSWKWNKLWSVLAHFGDENVGTWKKLA